MNNPHESSNTTSGDNLPFPGELTDEVNGQIHWSKRPVPEGLLPDAVVVAGLLGLLCALMLDGGIALRLYSMALLTYCLLFGIIIFRRKDDISTLDRLLIRFGIVPLLVAFFYLQAMMS